MLSHILEMLPILYLLLALAVGYLLGRYRSSSFQNREEALVRRELQANFSGP